jgi:hypothetical protein
VSPRPGPRVPAKIIVSFEIALGRRSVALDSRPRRHTRARDRSSIRYRRSRWRR